MSEEVDAAIRLGLELFRKTVREGEAFYSLYDLVFDDIKPRSSKGVFERLFVDRDSNFWTRQEDLIGILVGAGLAQTQRSQIAGHGGADYSIKLTPLGRAIFSLAALQSERRAGEIDGLSIEDLSILLRDDELTAGLSRSLSHDLDEHLDQLNLTNFQRSTVQSYVNVMVAICEMPERDVRLFWTVLERLNQFAGVASLIVAILALKAVR